MDISDDQTQQVRQIALEVDLNLVVLFGSRARGRAMPQSDTDIAVRGSRPLSLEQRLAVARRFDDVFPDCDVCDIRSSPPLLLAAIAEHGRLLFQKGAHDFAYFRISAFNQFWDAQELFERLRARNADAIRKLGASR